MKHLPRLLTAADAARLAGGAITPAAIRKAADEGRLEVETRTAGGVRLFTRGGVERFLAAREAGRSSTGGATGQQSRGRQGAGRE